jgi:hypothetical protein
MAPDPEDGGADQAEASHGSQECMPCRGTGKVISNLGGHASKVTCPWCEGDGVRHAEIDAQAHWSNTEAGEGQEGAAEDEAEADGDQESESAEGAGAAA